MSIDHDTRVQQIVVAFDEANAALIARLESVTDEAAARLPEGEGWTAAQVGVHVARATTTFAKIVSGALGAATPTPPDFVERPWEEVAAKIPEKATAPERLRPEEGLTRARAIDELRSSAETFGSALRGLAPERAAEYAFTYPMVGTISLYQVGEWAAGHVKRHTRQIDRVLAGTE